MRPAIFGLFALGCVDVGASSAEVVYGTDDRVEVYEQPAGVHRTIAETAIAMQVGAEWLDRSDPSDVQVTYTRTLGEANSLCADVRYQDQIEPGTCSGTLIDARHILTAGHCVAAAEDCDGASWPWVFGFSYEAAGVLRTLTEDDVYFCARTVAFRNDLGGDYAVIELDRDVVGHTPARVGGDVPLGTAVTMIGHPNGIPMKIAGNATIRGETSIEYFSDVDAFFGNSGSGVFDSAGNTVAILVAGAPRDFENRPGGCREIVVIDPVPAGEGETLTRVTEAIDAFCATGVSSPVCGAPLIDAGPSPIDAGPEIDGGPSSIDAGLSEDDAGVVPDTDAGTTERDASIAGDAGTIEEDGGCGCRVSSSDPRAFPIALVVIAALFVRRRRPSR